jgi:protein-tyrosine phosphatase
MARRIERTILFLCTGNYYRSRFAECLFNAAWPGGPDCRGGRRPGGLALERGVRNVGPMAVSAVNALEALGVCAADAVARYPVQATPDDFALARGMPPRAEADVGLAVESVR